MSLDSPPESVALGTIIGQRYRIERKLGAGGMGEVYLVQHIHTDKRFALKVLHTTIISDTNALERFRREARTPARIESEHVVDVTDADAAPELGGAPFIIMEYLRGEDLDHYIEGRGAIDPREVVLYLRQVARALDKAHALGIIHRDLKPENIFLTRREDGSPHIKVLDFGIAKFTSHATSDLVKKTATSPGEIFGTPLYMAPEQAKGESSAISPQTDLWALGLIAHRMLTGADFWDAQTLTALIAQIVYEPMQKPSAKGFDLGPAYDAWFLRSCNRDPKQRWTSAGEAVAMLGQALGLGEADLGPELARLSRDTSLPVSQGHGRTSAVAISSGGRATGGTQALSKTELQLAQTGMISSPPPPQDRSTVVKVAAAALVVGALGAGLWVWSRPPASTVGGDARAATGAPSTAPSATPEPPDSGAKPVVEPLVSPEASASASAAPSVSASASAAPSASASATSTLAKPGAATATKPLTKPTATTTAAATTATTATATSKPPPPPPPDDPLGSRR